MKNFTVENFLQSTQHQYYNNFKYWYSFQFNISWWCSWRRNNRVFSVFFAQKIDGYINRRKESLSFLLRCNWFVIVIRNLWTFFPPSHSHVVVKMKIKCKLHHEKEIENNKDKLVKFCHATFFYRFSCSKNERFLPSILMRSERYHLESHLSMKHDWIMLLLNVPQCLINRSLTKGKKCISSWMLWRAS